MKNFILKWFHNGVCLALFLSLPILLACGREGENSPEAREAVPAVKPVKAVSVKAQPLTGQVEYAGTLSAHRKVNVAAELGGTIERLFFERGDKVKKGQALAEVSTSSIRIEVQQAEAAQAVSASQLRKVEKGSRPEEIRIVAAAVEQAESALNEAENNFKRIQDLHDYKAASKVDYDSAKRAVERARANLESARQQLELAKKGPRIEEREAAHAGLQQARASLAMTKDRLKKSILKSPLEGVIAFRKVEEQEVVGPGTIVTQVVDTSRMKIQLSLGERYIPILDRKKRFLFTVDAIAKEVFDCELSFVSPTADPVTHSFPIELTVIQADPRMADGMTVRIKFPLVDQNKSIKVHTSWLSEKKGEIGLFVVDKGTAMFKRATLGSYYEYEVEILSGLEENDLVITNPAGLKTGDPVRVLRSP